jgi:ferritin-like metal-binding protein YciE
MDTLRQLFEATLKDVYYAEKAIVKALPKMTEAASAKVLVAAFSEHLSETKGQIIRLDEVFKILGIKPAGKECHAIKGLIEEGEALISEKPEAAVLDAGLLACAQAIEHYEMARYGTLRAWADELRMGDAASLLQQTLAEEKSADAKLSVLALAKINARADAGESNHRDQAPAVERSSKSGSRSTVHRQKSVPSGL